jgi:hypothetical protein
MSLISSTSLVGISQHGSDCLDTHKLTVQTKVEKHEEKYERPEWRPGHFLDSLGIRDECKPWTYELQEQID